MAHSSQHEVIAVAMRARDGRLEAFVSRVERRDDESLESALGRAVDVTALAHVEQLETRVLRNGALATAYLGLARADADLGGHWQAAAIRRPPDDRALVAAAPARLTAKPS